MVWTVLTVAVVLVGVLLIVVTKISNDNQASAAPAVGDHWHAFLGVDVCGQWLPSAPEFEKRANEPNLGSGLHSHADGLMHIEPTSSDETGARATVGRFIDYGGWSLSDSSMKLWDGLEHKNGQDCGKGASAKPAEIQWSVGRLGKPWTGKPRTGNPADFHPKNADIVAVYFLPKGEKLAEPPNVEQAFSNNNVSGGAPVPGTGTTTPVGGTGSTPTTVPTGSTGSTP
jgi:hypothetical protein